MRLLLVIFLGVHFIFSEKLYSQELPPINVYYPTDYGAESQNWGISQGSNGTVYVANNLGLLEFNGAKWKLYQTPNGSIMRSVEVIKNFIYTGFYKDFGYWKRNDFGKLYYTSLVKEYDIPVLEDEQFWNIIKFEDWLIFQSLKRIYLLNPETKEYKIISSDVKITKLFKVQNAVYFQKYGQGLYKIENGKSKRISQDNIFKENTIIDMVQNENKVLILTDKQGFFSLSDKTLIPEIYLNTSLKNKTIYCSVQLENKGFAIGTISDGVILLDKGGNVTYAISQKNGLSNNTVLSIYEDRNNNLWLGLDNGINNININSSVKIYTENEGRIGTIYTSVLYDDDLYLGTNQGLFVKGKEENGNFELIEGTQGQVWSLQIIKDELFCGHDMGTFIIKDRKISYKLDVQGTWGVKFLDTNVLLQGNYSGLYILEKGNKKWRVKNKIKGFDNSSRFFEVYTSNKIIVNHEYKGVFKLSIDEDYSRVVQIEQDTAMNKGVHSSLLTYHSDVLYAFKGGVFKYTKENTFVKDSILSDFFNESSFTSGKLIFDQTNNILWGFNKKTIKYIQSNTIDGKTRIKEIPIMQRLRKGAVGFENILPMKQDKFLVGANNGYLILDLNKEQNTSSTYRIAIDVIKKKQLNTQKEEVSLQETGNLAHNENNLEFYFSVPNFSAVQETQYQYKLEGYLNDWTSWSKKSEATFENIPFGTYLFKVRGKVGDALVTNTATYQFSVAKPWYLHNASLTVYILGFLCFSYFLDKLYKRYYRKQREELLEKQEKEYRLKVLAADKELMKVKNEQLNSDIESKNRELAISTMSIIKKNELLNAIKKELIAEEEGGIKNVVRIINRNMNTNDDWKMFEEAFNNADKDFIHKLKSAHPKLTPNDLRLCAYLRLNLSSKEIAPLLNISYRSVEVKRYRLRKKMDLEHDVNLTNYILGL